MNVFINVGTPLEASSAALITRAFTQALMRDEPSQAPAVPSIPKAEPTERYAGVVLDEAGKPTHHLFLLNATPGKRMKWQEAVDWALGLGASLPTRFESALLYANLRGQFDTVGWYWTGTQCSADDAWLQDFLNGTQDDGAKSYEAQVRAVRRLEI